MSLFTVHLDYYCTPQIDRYLTLYLAKYSKFTV